jgi:hypothetical protein
LITATGGNQTVRTNVFSGNSNNGIEIGGNASGIRVDPVIAGLDTKGTSLLPNGGDGLLIDGTDEPEGPPLCAVSFSPSYCSAVSARPCR